MPGTSAIVTLVIALVVGVCAAPHAAAQRSSYTRDLPDSLVRRAKITEPAAAATARRRIPRGTITAVELEVEHATLIYSYELKTPGKAGIDEVNVDAISGKVIGVAHESSATERKEAAEDASAARAGASKRKRP